jgi:hypothetical protein
MSDEDGPSCDRCGDPRHRWDGRCEMPIASAFSEETTRALAASDGDLSRHRRVVVGDLVLGQQIIVNRNLPDGALEP